MTAVVAPFELWSRSDWPNVDVVGESHYSDAIRAALPALSQGRAEVRVTAELVPEPQNRHDPNAVRVQVGSRCVGYLARDVARQYSPLFQRLLARGLAPVTSARVYGYESVDYVLDRRGRTVESREFVGSVSIVLDDVHLCVPANLPPREPHRLLPHGASLQLKGEEAHLDVLAPLVAQHGEAAVHATLRAITPATGRAAKRIVEVQVDNQTIGQLTPAMSEHYLALIDRLHDAGHLTVAHVHLTGNALKVEASLYAERSHQLPASWLATLPDVNDRPAISAGGQTDRGADLTAVPKLPAPPQEVLSVRSPGLTVAQLSPALVVPPRPTRILFATPPGWPAAPEGWEPPPGWTPPGDWPAPPTGWAFWVTG